MIYSLSDLHLDGGRNKPMHVFSKEWENHQEKIKIQWEEVVGEDDTVLVAGDISWALKFEESFEDLKFIDSLPGKKILSRGNHDFWWASLKKMNDLGFKTLHFLQNNSYSVEDYEIVGSRIWLDSTHKDYTEDDKKITERELIRLKLSLDSAKKGRPIIAMIHYPPFDSKKEPNVYAKLLEEYKVEACVYGHLHADGIKQAVEGNINGVEYYLTSADYLKFKPIIIRR